MRKGDEERKMEENGVGSQRNKGWVLEKEGGQREKGIGRWREGDKRAKEVGEIKEEEEGSGTRQV